MVMSPEPAPPQSSLIPSGTGPTLQITLGSANYAFALKGRVEKHRKRTNGAVIQQTGRSANQDILDSPWHISDIAGIGVAKTDADVIPDSDRRAFEMSNVDHWPGMWCLGPAAQSTTDQSSTRRVAGFTNAGATGLRYFGNNVTTAGLEQEASWTGSTTTWASDSITSSYEALGAGYSGFPVAGVTTIGSTVAILRNRPQVDSATSNSVRQLLNGGSYLEHSATGDYTRAPAQASGNASYGLVVIGTKIYTAYGGGVGGSYSLSSGTSSAPTVWAAEANTAMQLASTPRSVLGWVNGSGALQVTVCGSDSIWQAISGGTSAKIVDLSNDINNNNGAGVTVFNPQIGGTAGAFSFLIVPQGRRLWAFHWVGNGTTAQLAGEDILASLPHGLPIYRQGLVLAVAASRRFVWFAIGGEDASHTGGIYKAQYDGKGWRVWGPVYDIATANKQIRAMYASTSDDGTTRIHFAEDTTAGGSVTTQKFLANIDEDPRYVTSYKHTTATGSLILSKNDRDLPQFNGIWRKVQFTGTNFSASNKVSAVNASADAAPVGADAAWAASLGSVTATLGSVNFTGTPAGTGQSANAMQLRIDIVGTANASPYIESTDVFVRKQPAIKYVYVFEVDLEATASGTGRNIETVVADIETIVGAATDIQVSWGSRVSSVVMEPYYYAGFGFEPDYWSLLGGEQQGTGGQGREIPKSVKVALAEV